MFQKLRAAILSFKGYWTELLHDIDGYPSSKRLGYLLSVFVVLGAFFANIFFKIVVDSHILDAALGIGGIGGAGIAAERFGKLLPAGDGHGSDDKDLT